MAKAIKSKTEVNPQEQFAALVAQYEALPASDPNAFTGKNPNAPASDFQKGVLGKMGITPHESTTQLSAHASMKAFADMYPAQADAVWAEQSALAEARKAEKAAESGGAPGFKKYTVNKDQVGLPATYHQIVQLNSAGFRKYQDPSPIPTRGEVADKLNALQAADKPAYDAAMTKANDTVQKWKHSPPSAAQTNFAKTLGIKVTPFTPAVGAVAQKGSTGFSVGEKIHDIKANEPEKYAQLRAEHVASQESAKAAQATAQTAAPALNMAALQQQGAAAVAEKAASNAAKNSGAPTLAVPDAAPAVQAEAPQAS
jgi:hypothetical protein